MTRSRPFEGPTELETLLRVQKGDFTPARGRLARARAPRSPPSSASAMRHNPAERYQSAEEMLDRSRARLPHRVPPRGPDGAQTLAGGADAQDGQLPISKAPEKLAAVRSGGGGTGSGEIEGHDVVLESEEDIEEENRLGREATSRASRRGADGGMTAAVAPARRSQRASRPAGRRGGPRRRERRLELPLPCPGGRASGPGAGASAQQRRTSPDPLSALVLHRRRAFGGRLPRGLLAGEWSNRPADGAGRHRPDGRRRPAWPDRPPAGSDTAPAKKGAARKRPPARRPSPRRTGALPGPATRGARTRERRRARTRRAKNPERAKAAHEGRAAPPRPVSARTRGRARRRPTSCKRMMAPDPSLAAPAPGGPRHAAARRRRLPRTRSGSGDRGAGSSRGPGRRAGLSRFQGLPCLGRRPVV